MEQQFGPVTASHIARRAEELRIIYVGMSMAVVALSLPSIPLLRAVNEACGNRGVPVDQPFSITEGVGDDGETFSSREILIQCANLSGDSRVEDLLHVAMMQGGIRVAALVESGNFRDRENPLLEFTRHFRNACAHNGNWHFRGGEPRARAELRGKMLDPSLHGQRAVWAWVTPLLYMQWLADIRDHFAEVGRARGEEPQPVAQNPPRLV
ncbi:hypothetical protein [Nocardioides ochotonae]|uniref:hypothetical protein n=1 Tax=Nocardioides ochotonae TaxID=2685869 RepID=UPI00140BD578|nr:hypothetical protein [Nocardioides ochotonae]